ncbi:MAG: zinc metalloprotease HtpX [Legionellaceae bacterium]|nr:zinc metalloprotease HtpX [Legionellaceae bacterium]
MTQEKYVSVAPDWRAELRRNDRKTRWVILMFFLMYICVGFVCDVSMLLSTHPHMTPLADVQALLTGKIVPVVTLIMFGVAGISVLVTFALHNRLMLLGTTSREITRATARTAQEVQLIGVLEEMKIAAGMLYMPKVYIIEADYMNAFASGYSERSAMVAVTQGLLDKLDRAELQAVIAHELSHIRHHDIKLTLFVAVLSNLLLMMIDTIFYNMLFGGNRDSQQSNNGFFLVVILLRYILPVMTVALSMYMSRTREYMADSGCVELMRDNTPLAHALLKIEQDYAAHEQAYGQAYGQTAHEQVRLAAYLFDPSDMQTVKSLTHRFTTHPSIADRLKAIGFRKTS